MKTTELIDVYIKVVKGKTVCICHREDKRCDSPCEEDTVERDLFRDWEKTMRQDKYGKCPGL